MTRQAKRRSGTRRDTTREDKTKRETRQEKSRNETRNEAMIRVETRRRQAAREKKGLEMRRQHETIKAKGEMQPS